MRKLFKGGTYSREETIVFSRKFPRKLFFFIQILLPVLSKKRISLNKQRVAKGKKVAKTRVGWQRERKVPKQE